MSNLDDKARGAGNDAIGNTKQAIGEATGNEKLQAEGKAQELKGDAQTALGNVKEAVGDALENLGNKLKGSGS